MQTNISDLPKPQERQWLVTVHVPWPKPWQIRFMRAWQFTIERSGDWSRTISGDETVRHILDALKRRQFHGTARRCGAEPPASVLPEPANPAIGLKRLADGSIDRNHRIIASPSYGEGHGKTSGRSP